MGTDEHKILFWDRAEPKRTGIQGVFQVLGDALAKHPAVLAFKRSFLKNRSITHAGPHSI
jgi:hypothetical protein